MSVCFFFFSDKQASSAGLHFKGFKQKCVLNYDQWYYCISSDSHQITAKQLLNVCVCTAEDYKGPVPILVRSGGKGTPADSGLQRKTYTSMQTKAKVKMHECRGEQLMGHQ